MKVIELNDAAGFPPRIRTAAEKLEHDIWEILDTAANAGVPLSMMLGVFELTKDDLIRFTRMEGGEE